MTWDVTHELSPADFVKALTPEEATSLARALWEAGYREPGVETTQLLAAKDAHLADMRRLVFERSWFLPSAAASPAGIGQALGKLEPGDLGVMR